MTASNRRRWTAEEKLRILREARQTGQTVSEVCRRRQISPGQFYACEKLAREGALESMTSWAHYYNNERPHLALNCLCPKDYYRGNPEARLVEREQKLSSAMQAPALYWETYALVKEQHELSLV